MSTIIRSGRFLPLATVLGVVVLVAFAMSLRPRGDATTAAIATASQRVSDAPAAPTPRPSIVPTNRPLSIPTRTPATPSPSDGRHSGRLGNVEITMAGDWGIATGWTRMTLAKGAFIGLATTETVSLVTPGEDLVIARVDSYPDRRTFTVSGRTLDELADSIDAGLGGGTRSAIKVGAAAGYRWFVAQASITRPLAGLVAFEWKGDFYVIEEHFPLDAAFEGYLGDVLAGLKLLPA